MQRHRNAAGRLTKSAAADRVANPHVFCIILRLRNEQRTSSCCSIPSKVRSQRHIASKRPRAQTQLVVRWQPADPPAVSRDRCCALLGRWLTQPLSRAARISSAAPPPPSTWSISSRSVRRGTSAPCAGYTSHEPLPTYPRTMLTPLRTTLRAATPWP